MGSGSTSLKLVVPKSLQQEVFRLAHDVKTACHPGIDKILLKLKRLVFWPQVSRDVKLYVSTCAACITSKKPKQKPKAALGEYHAGVPMERVHMDLLGPVPTSAMGHKYVLVLVDQFTKWEECFPLTEQTMEKVAKVSVTFFLAARPAIRFIRVKANSLRESFSILSVICWKWPKQGPLLTIHAQTGRWDG